MWRTAPCGYPSQPLTLQYAEREGVQTAPSVSFHITMEVTKASRSNPLLSSWSKERGRKKKEKSCNRSNKVHRMSGLCIKWRRINLLWVRRCLKRAGVYKLGFTLSRDPKIGLKINCLEDQKPKAEYPRWKSNFIHISVTPGYRQHYLLITFWNEKNARNGKKRGLLFVHHVFALWFIRRLMKMISTRDERVQSKTILYYNWGVWKVSSRVLS